MVRRFEDILERVREYNPAADLDLLRRAYIFSAREHRDQKRRKEMARRLKQEEKNKKRLARKEDGKKSLDELELDAEVDAEGGRLGVEAVADDDGVTDDDGVESPASDSADAPQESSPPKA